MLAGQSTSPSTLATSTVPALSEAAIRPGRRRGLSQLYNQLLHHSQQYPNDSSARQSPARPALARSQTSPVPSVSTPSLSLTGSSTPQSRDNTENPGNTRPGLHTRARGQRMLPIINSHPFTDAQHASTAESSLLATTTAPLAQMTSARSEGGASTISHSSLPSIQFIPASDPTRARPSLDFRRITRILPSQSAVIRVGRYSERDSAADPNGSAPSDAPIGFKSKVVSRRHCEFSYANNQWFIKDVKSSSGTFLNHIRLSQPGMESRLFPVNDGDTVQLGIDFKGGEEMIFRCVKIRVETNRGWQRGLNKFNKTTHKQLRALARGRAKDSDTSSKHSTDCTICLNSIAPCQALFVAPCSHTWHYKCIRQILDNSSSSQFLCPNCRAQADLEADVETEELEDYDEIDDFDGLDEDGDASRTGEGPDDALHNASGTDEEAPQRRAATDRIATPPLTETDLGGVDDATWGLSSLSLRQNNAHLASLDDTINQIGRDELQGALPNATSSLNPGATSFLPPPSFTLSSPRPIPGAHGVASTRARTDTNNTAASEFSDATSDVNEAAATSPNLGPSSLEGLTRDGPMTPRNTAGPFVFDGAADGRRVGQ